MFLTIGTSKSMSGSFLFLLASEIDLFKTDWKYSISWSELERALAFSSDLEFLSTWAFEDFSRLLAFSSGGQPLLLPLRYSSNFLKDLFCSFDGVNFCSRVLEKKKSIETWISGDYNAFARIVAHTHTHTPKQKNGKWTLTSSRIVYGGQHDPSRLGL